MAAETGAVHRLFRSGDGIWQAECLEDGPVDGICGSGLVDLLAHLIRGKEIDERGRLRTGPVEVNVAGRCFSVSKADIDMLQRAKAAIAAGLETLTRRAGVLMGEIRDVHVAGAFGLHLHLINAISIGLLPDIPIERFHLAGNTALSGALDVMLSPAAEAAACRARDKTRLINVSMEPDFDDLFVERLFLRPFAGGHTG